MRHAFAALALAALALSACQRSDAPAPGADSTAAASGAPATPVSIPGYTAYGSPSPDTFAVLPAEDVTAAIEEYAGRHVQISGTVVEVCQAAGCWATLATPTGTVRVAMPKDSAGAYVFTLPKDLSGRFIIAEGVFDEATVSKEHAAHMQAEGQAPAEGHAHDHDDAPAEAGETVPELRLTATGVLVRNT